MTFDVNMALNLTGKKVTAGRLVVLYIQITDEFYNCGQHFLQAYNISFLLIYLQYITVLIFHIICNCTGYQSVINLLLQFENFMTQSLCIFRCVLKMFNLPRKHHYFCKY